MMANEKINFLLMKKLLMHAFQELLGKAESALLFQPKDAVSSDRKIEEKSSGVWGKAIDETGIQLADKFEEIAARGLMIRAGRASLQILRKNSNIISNLGSIDNRLKPVKKRFADSLDTLAKFFSNDDVIINLIEEETYKYIWQIKTTSINLSQYIPFYFFGLLEEFCGWLDARKDYQMFYSLADETIKNCEIHIEIRDPQ